MFGRTRRCEQRYRVRIAIMCAGAGVRVVGGAVLTAFTFDICGRTGDGVITSPPAQHGFDMIVTFGSRGDSSACSTTLKPREGSAALFEIAYVGKTAEGSSMLLLYGTQGYSHHAGVFIYIQWFSNGFPDPLACSIARFQQMEMLHRAIFF